ncbi:type 1 glutamine amidotransferase-like domain-containing protein [Erysipelothrix sp. HDW6C]|uniref:Type 1 glutamine amidotransferase-like domain-containing protein n=1 Tax=Erysipelothrix sp. HDW6C TaxID=2714930 RepID=UPI0014099434|nr:Type 1 glutamine amidotransferase-like domain-containing protein [Erysipelothrix sp. HDW6C]QIK70469.1 type 1 glutamine amidotransferase-like domain-containing protein [Erysipelothrix sp. HDW6C]
MGKIVTIGGGEYELNETLKIDKKIISLSSKSNPRLLFIPTASSDAPAYSAGIKKHFEALGATVDVLNLHSATQSGEEIEAIILDHDIIYVGGGNTRMMMTLWETFNLDQALRKAFNQDKVLAGLSAGSICWYQWGHSDSNSFGPSDTWVWSKVAGLGFINASHVPHFDEEGRHSYDDMFAQDSALPGIALDNQVALVYDGHEFSIIKDNPEKRAIIYTAHDGVIEKVNLDDGDRVELSINI